jgi:ankyrin repeat protein
VAAEKGKLEVVELLARIQDVDINARDARGRTPLSLAAANGHEAVVKLLLALDDIDINFMDEAGRTPLFRASEAGHDAVVKLLLAKGGVNGMPTVTSWGQGTLNDYQMRLRLLQQQNEKRLLMARQELDNLGLPRTN